MSGQERNGQRPTLKYTDLEMAYSFASSGADLVDAAAYVCRASGKIYWVSSELGDDAEVPDGVEDLERYAVIPNKYDLDLGKRLVTRFIKSHMPEHYDRVSEIFRRRGAYSRYKDLLLKLGQLDAWYRFEEAATEAALRDWAEAEGFDVEPAENQKTPDRVYQFRIELNETAPLIWRRIQVPDRYTFWDLHVAIQDAMGWLDRHLHAFRVGAPGSAGFVEIGIPDDDLQPEISGITAGWEIPISDYFQEAGATVVYEYDFGDGWLHEVTLEDILPSEEDQRYPRCIDGAMACPVEDCGGIPGHYRMLEVLSDPNNEEHEEVLEWLGGNYDPNDFAPPKVRFDDPRKRWRMAFSEN